VDGFGGELQQHISYTIFPFEGPEKSSLPTSFCLLLTVDFGSKTPILSHRIQ
jgi:hypothetical protein